MFNEDFSCHSTFLYGAGPGDLLYSMLRCTEREDGHRRKSFLFKKNRDWRQSYVYFFLARARLCCNNFAMSCHPIFRFSRVVYIDSNPKSCRRSYTRLRLKGTQYWEFFWVRFRILCYFIVSYAQILRFCKKTFFDQATIGGDTIIPRSLRLSRIEFSLVWD